MLAICVGPPSPPFHFIGDRGSAVALALIIEEPRRTIAKRKQGTEATSARLPDCGRIGLCYQFREMSMDDSAQGIATASFTLQSSLLQALVRKGVLSPAEALDIVDTSLRSAANQPDAESTLEAAEIARICLLGIREGLAEMTSQS